MSARLRYVSETHKKTSIILGGRAIAGRASVAKTTLRSERERVLITARAELILHEFPLLSVATRRQQQRLNLLPETSGLLDLWNGGRWTFFGTSSRNVTTKLVEQTHTQALTREGSSAKRDPYGFDLRLFPRACGLFVRKSTGLKPPELV